MASLPGSSFSKINLSCKPRIIAMLKKYNKINPTKIRIAKPFPDEEDLQKDFH
jgi:hypothetical protein